MNFKVKATNENARVEVSAPYEKDGVMYADVNYSTETPEMPKSFKIEFSVPDIDCYSIWSPGQAGGKLYKGPSWGKRNTGSRLASGMPYHQLLSINGQNRLAITLSDPKTPTVISTGTDEGEGNSVICIEFFSQPTTAVDKYTATIRLDMRDIPYYDSIYDAVAWWENDCGYKPAYVPEHAKLPMNSLWYSFHQNLSTEAIVEQCRLSKPLGMDTVIVDDGWQTENNYGGYGYCGDWEVATSKIPDMKELVDRVHETGMKMMLWYSVPWIGKHTKVYDRFKDMILDGNNTSEWGALDPRYKETREYLVGVYAKAVRDWGLDGLKLDFIDSFRLAGKSFEPDPRRDITSLEEAVDVLMKEVTEALLEINPEILIEFRQSYVGPTIRKYGNMLRVADCPHDAMRNRTEIASLRYTSGKTAVHSDMLMWNNNEPVEAAAMQLVAVLYSVPQISMLIEKLNPEHYKMLKYYLSFWREHRDVLLDGKLTGKNPESMYSVLCSELDRKAVLTMYTDPVVQGNFDELVAVNATPSDSLYLKGFAGKKYRTVNCMGEETDSGVVETDLFEVKVPMCGMVFAE